MKPIVPILGLIAALWLFLGTAWFSSNYCGAPANSFQITDNTFNASSSETFMFFKSSASASINPEITNAFKKIAGHLEKNPEKQLSLAGLFTSDEDNTSDYDNLGIARAERIKQLLSEMNADESRIHTSANEVDNLFFMPDDDDELKMFGGVNFLFHDVEVEGRGEKAEPISYKEGSISSGNNRPTGSNRPTDIDEPQFLDITEVSSSFTKEDGFKSYFRNLKDYLEANPGKRLVVTCYNDDSRLAQSITKKVKNIFRKNGLKDVKITRKINDIADSPEEKAGVNIVII